VGGILPPAGKPDNGQSACRLFRPAAEPFSRRVGKLENLGEGGGRTGGRTGTIRPQLTVTAPDVRRQSIGSSRSSSIAGHSSS
ncbi:hypothetical protein ABTO49_21695, partial [Acinetobacter baumannii]